MGYKIIYQLKNELNEPKILGTNNQIIRFIEDVYGQEVIVRRADVLIDEENTKNEELLYILFSSLETLFDKHKLNDTDIFSIVKNLNKDNYVDIIDLFIKRQVLITTSTGKMIYPRTLNQALYLKALDQNDIVFGVGPAGTGKTFLAVLYAVSALKSGMVKKIVLVRPVVEAGEKLGYLPGDLKEKIDPYLIPLYDGLEEAIGKETVEKMIAKGIIEVSPLAYMRGRTLENAIIILDEAQNTTKTQMKMFLTRLGFQSKMIITGDITQIDLPSKSYSGLIEATNILQNISGIEFIYFDKFDVMRHPLLHKIIQRYEEN